MSQLTTYPQLVKSIDDEFQRGIFEAKKYLEHQRVVTYWRVGQYIHDYLKTHRIHEDNQQKKFFIQLSKDLNRDNYFLKQLCIFFVEYPQVPNQNGIVWSHYRELLLIPGKKERKKWERRIVRESIPCKDFYDIIHEGRQREAVEREPVEKAGRLNCRRGRLYTYRMISPNEIPWSSDSVVVNLGFGIRRQIAAKTTASLGVGQRVVSYKSGGTYEIKRSDVPSEELYTYRALVERLIDGDTIIANIDCGFDCWSHQRLRLFGVNAPEMSAEGGVAAKRFVTRMLKPCPWIIVKTYLDRQGKYGRYLADVFFMAGKAGAADPHRVAAEGTHLNHLLVDEGHAEIYAG